MKWYKEADHKFTLDREVLRKKVQPALYKANNIVLEYYDKASSQDKFFMGPAIKDEYIKLLKENIDFFEDSFAAEYKEITKQQEAEK